MDAPSTDVGWEEVERLVERVAAAVRPRIGRYDRVLGVSRGGLVPAALVARRLGVRRIDTVQVLHYEGSVRRERAEVEGDGARLAALARAPGRTLVVDDVFESGGTIRAIAAHLPEAAYAVLVVKDPSACAGPGGCVEVRTAGGSVVVGGRLAPADRWVVFPWSDPGESAS